MNRTALFSLTASLALVTLAGCVGVPGIGMGGPQPKQLELDPAPMTFSGDISAFVVGTWSPSTKVSTQLPGISASQAAGMAEPDASQYWEFSADGSMVMRTPALPGKVGGTWTLQGTTIQINYSTYGGKPMEQARQELQAAAETGTRGGVRNEIVSDWLFQTLPKYTQAVIGEDKKSLEFIGSSSLPGMESMTEGEQQALSRMVLETLVRMKVKS